jgi:predicted RNase H-like HicB family nuclease
MPFIIHRKPPYRVFIEEGPSGAMAHVAELPGCFALGSDAPRALAATPAAITAFLAWLKSHREPLVPEAHVARPSAADLYMAETRKEGAPLAAGSKASIFDFDRAPWTDEKLERSLRWLSYSRADLLSVIEPLTEEQMHLIQVNSGRSLNDTLWHIANAEYGYIDSVAGPLEGKEPVTDDQPADIRERLSVIREIFMRRAMQIPPEKRPEVVLPTWTGRPGEAWALPKAVRRALEHEREHLQEISRAL